MNVGGWLLSNASCRNISLEDRTMRKKAKKETIAPPTKRALKDAGKELKKGHPAGGRTLADGAVAKEEGAKRK